MPSGPSPPLATLPPPTRLEKALVRGALAALGRPPLRVVFWNGEAVQPAGREPRASVRLRDRSLLRGLLRGPELAFGDAYAEGGLELDGDLPRVLETVFRGSGRPPLWARGLLRGAGLGRRLRRNGRRRARRNVHSHYDLGNDFYALWLDERLVYTCAFFPGEETSLEQAQRAKLERVCRKLDLRPGERVIEAGCGWGAFALHAAECHGVRVLACNVSEEQLRFAREEARRRGLAGRVEFALEDWRELRGRCDAFVSIGMLEHVGRAHYRPLGRVIDRLLPAHGRGLLHFIGHARRVPISSWLEQRIFPGAYIPALSEMLPVLEPHGFAVVDVENLRRHYARTLEHWLERFDKAADRIEATYDARFVRAWRLYLASSIAAFRTGGSQLFQVLFARPGDARLPFVRSD
jgi:cyclopropane-fatty-acyl-phospholipid synthase